METAAPWKAWKTNCMFSTLPTALGKLGKKHYAEFSTVPTASAAGYSYEEESRSNNASKAVSNWIGQDGAESVKNSSRRHSP